MGRERRRTRERVRVKDRDDRVGPINGTAGMAVPEQQSPRDCVSGTSSFRSSVVQLHSLSSTTFWKRRRGSAVGDPMAKFFGEFANSVCVRAFSHCTRQRS